MNAQSIFDDIAGSLNYFDRIAGLFWSVVYRDTGHRFKVMYEDRGGEHSRDDIKRMLAKYRIPTYSQGFDADHMYFRVKNRQAKWADYIMRRAGVEIVGEPLGPDPGPGPLPKAWADHPKGKAKGRAKRKK